jgi:hypothetical protein
MPPKMAEQIQLCRNLAYFDEELTVGGNLGGGL